MVIPNTFGIRGEKVIASYNFIEFASGTGVINMYAGNTVDKKLLSNVIYSSDVVSTGSGHTTSVSYVKMLDIDFDVLINKPLIIEGTTAVNVPIGLKQIGNTAGAGGYVIARLKKEDVTIVTNQSRVVSNPTTAQKYDMLGIDLVIPKTHYKIGDILRLTVEGWCKSGNGTNWNSVQIGNDPMNRTTGWDTTGAVSSKLTFQMPVRINL